MVEITYEVTKEIEILKLALKMLEEGTKTNNFSLVKYAFEIINATEWYKPNFSL